MQTTFIRMLLAWVAIIVLLSGCATTSTPPTPVPTASPSEMHKQHMAAVDQIKQFSAKGRLGVITDPKNFTAKLVWNHQPESDNIDIYSPLGSKVANITKSAQEVALTNNKQHVIYAKDAETLTEEHLGFRLPLSGLSAWAIGKASNNSIAEIITWDRYGRIDHIQQDGWNIDYQDYVDFEGYFLPKKVSLKNEKIRLKLIIDTWSGITAQDANIITQQ